MQTDIFIMTNYTGPTKAEGKYCFLLRVKTASGDATYFDNIAHPAAGASRNRAELMALNDALSHMKKPSEICVHMDTSYLRSAVVLWSAKWLLSDFKNSKGEEVANADLWREVFEKLKPHKVSFDVFESPKEGGPAPHEYYRAMKTVLRKGE